MIHITIAVLSQMMIHPLTQPHLLLMGSEAVARFRCRGSWYLYISGRLLKAKSEIKCIGCDLVPCSNLGPFYLTGNEALSSLSGKEKETNHQDCYNHRGITFSLC